MRLKVREIYSVGHFGNTYDMVGKYKMQEILEEAKWWGFNRYCDWFDTVYLTRKFTNKTERVWPTKFTWENKKIKFKLAQKIGLETDLNINPNHVFFDQLQGDLLAQTDDKFFGHLLCPSKPNARDIILKNYKEWFSDLKKEGIYLNSISSAAYDFGGCNCEKCKPWILTFANLTKDIYEIAITYFPEIELNITGWWWSVEDHNLFSQWADKNLSGKIKNFYAWVNYDKTTPENIPEGKIPSGTNLGIFLHIGYGDKEAILDGIYDVYGSWGVHSAPNRIYNTLLNLEKLGGKSVMAYDEGIFTDINKAITGAISSGKSNNVKEVLEEYTERYFKAKKTEKKEWTELILEIATPSNLNIKKTIEKFKKLTKNKEKNWRIEQIYCKLELLNINEEIEKDGGVNYKNLNKVEEFFKTKEYMFSSVFSVHPILYNWWTSYYPIFPNWYKNASSEEIAKLLYEKAGCISQKPNVKRILSEIDKIR